MDAIVTPIEASEEEHDPRLDLIERLTRALRQGRISFIPTPRSRNAVELTERGALQLVYEILSQTCEKLDERIEGLTAAREKLGADDAALASVAREADLNLQQRSEYYGEMLAQIEELREHLERDDDRFDLVQHFGRLTPGGDAALKEGEFC